MIATIGEETSIAIELLTTDRQPNLRRILDVAHPLAVHVRGADVELIVNQNEPNRDFVGLPGLACGFRAMPIRIPRSCRSRFRGDADQRSEVMPISVPTDVDQENDRVVMGVGTKLGTME